MDAAIRTVEQRVCGGGASDDVDAERARQNDAREQGRAEIEATPDEEETQYCPKCGAQRGGKAEREFVHTEYRNAQRLQPVDQDGFVVARLSVEVGGEKIAAPEHLQRSLAEGAFVHVEQRCVSEQEEEADEQRAQGKGRERTLPDKRGE
jgi:hypothetical protein